MFSASDFLSSLSLLFSKFAIVMSDSIILGIESSCDDTSAAVLKGNKILSNIAANQEIHNEYGGVVPELASRDHVRKLIPLINQLLEHGNRFRAVIETGGHRKIRAAMLDPLLHRSVMFNLDGDSYACATPTPRTKPYDKQRPAAAERYSDHRPGWGFSMSITGDFGKRRLIVRCAG